jgi:hypothetical protein
MSKELFKLHIEDIHSENCGDGSVWRQLKLSINPKNIVTTSW